MSDTNIGQFPTPTAPLGFNPVIRATVQRGIEVESIERVRNEDAFNRVVALAGFGFESESTPEEGTPFSLIRFFLPGGGNDAGVTSPLAVTWGLQGNDLEQGMWEHPRIKVETAKFATLGTAAGNELLKRLKTSIEAFVQGQTTVASVLLNVDPLAQDDGETTPITYDKIGAYIDLLRVRGVPLIEAEWAGFIESRLRGVEAFLTPQYVLTRQQTWASAAIAQVSLANVNRILTTSQLITLEGVPGNLIFSVPTGFWLKKTPQVQQQDDGVWVATNEWWWAEDYDGFVYRQA
jgi:hypothetical protein